MPSSNHESTLARQWEILKLLPTRRPGITVTDLHRKLAGAGHEVTRRTVERDLEGLCSVFPLTTNEISKPFGWYLRADSEISFPGMTLAEAVSLGLMEDVLRQMAPSCFATALESRLALANSMLREMPKNRNAKWTDLVRYIPPGLPMQKPAIKGEIMESIQQALLEKRQIQVEYHHPEADAGRDLTLHPLALVLQGARPYLVATAFRYSDVRFYAIQRVSRVEILDNPSKRPKGFSLDDYLSDGGGQFGDGTEIVLKARIEPHLAKLLEETSLSKDQKIIARSGVHTLTATVRDSWQLHFWILSQGAAITVTHPNPLRRRLVNTLKATLMNYTSAAMPSIDAAVSR